MMFDATFLALAAIAGCATSNRFARLDTQLRAQAERGDFNGVVLVAHHDVPALARAYGTGLSLDTCFNLASTSKLFTLVAIEQLVESGKLHPDDHVGTYTTSYPAVADATITQLRSHTSGLPAGIGPGAVLGHREQQTLDEMLAALAGPLDAPPGTRKQYSNIGFLGAGPHRRGRVGRAVRALRARAHRETSRHAAHRRELTRVRGTDDARHGPGAIGGAPGVSPAEGHARWRLVRQRERSAALHERAARPPPRRGGPRCARLCRTARGTVIA